ncbi:MAG: hypothetical protein J6V24_05005, partial [Clostridia bacterium]|nr:hypothetical protein [Clostridia bacterium]
TLCCAVEGYVQTRYSSIPSEELPENPSEDTYLSLLDTFWKENSEEMKNAVLAWEKDRTEEENRRLGINIPVDFADHCDGDMRRRQILAQYLSRLPDSMKTLQFENSDFVNSPPLSAEVSEFELVGIRDKVTVRESLGYRWYEVALFRVDFRLNVLDPDYICDLHNAPLKFDGDALVPEDGPILLAVVSEIDRNKDYTIHYTVAETKPDNRGIGNVFRFTSASPYIDIQSVNLSNAVTELVREYRNANP